MIKTFAVVTLGLAAIVGGVTPARADYVVYTNRATFEAAISGEKTETFNELGSSLQLPGSAGLSQATTPVGLIQPITVTGSNSYLVVGSASSLAGFYPTYGTYVLGPIATTAGSPEGITVTLPANKYDAAGADVAAYTAKSVVSFVATTSLGETLTGSVQVDGSTASSSLGFLGLVLTTPNDYVTSLTYSTPVGANQNVLIDNVSIGTFAPFAVPEPASMALMVTGVLVVGAGTVRHRLRSKSA